MAVCAGTSCRPAVSAAVHIRTNLVFILVRRYLRLCRQWSDDYDELERIWKEVIVD
jgi:hypothetical protein